MWTPSAALNKPLCEQVPTHAHRRIDPVTKLVAPHLPLLRLFAGFDDFNHVDCCVMESGNTHQTNEASRVVGMHPVNYLGAHIVDASVSDLGPGGSWCTCHLSSPADVCHKQFGARTAFKLAWCRGKGCVPHARSHQLKFPLPQRSLLHEQRK